MEAPLLSTDKKNLNCAGCGQQDVQHLCPCRESGLYLCDSCVTSHVAKYRGKSHNILPIQTLNYYKLPGYVDAFRERTNEKHDKALEELRSNLVKLDEWKSQFTSEVARLSASLSSKASKIAQDFDQVKRYIESEVLSGIQEMHQKVYEPSPRLLSPIARALWKYKPGAMRLIACHSDFATMFTPVEDYLGGLKVLLKVEFEGGEILKETNWGSEVVVVQKELILGDGYVGQRNEKRQKHGYGREDRGGEVFEGQWRHDQRTSGKHVAGRRATFGEFQRQATHRRCRTLIPLLCALVAGAIGAWHCGESEPPVLTLFQEGPRNISLGRFWGQWNAAGEKHGFGKLIYNTGEVYEGQWSSDLYHGKGRLRTSKGDLLEGDWQFGVLDGFGSVQYANGNSAAGHFCGGQLCGIGLTFTKLPNRTYVGEFERGMPTGKGAVFYSDLPLYTGLWKSGIKTGFGIEYSRDKLCFGQYTSNQLSGAGTCLFPPGLVFVGHWDSGRKEGNGTQYYPAEYFAGRWHAGTAIEGEFRYNESYRAQHEVAVHSLDTSLLDASWLLAVGPTKLEHGLYYGQLNAHGQRHGYGCQNYSDGSTYEGFWRRDLRHGKGTMRDRLGRVFEGDWAMNTFTGCGIMVWNETVRQGTWMNKKLEGLGMERFPYYTQMGEYVGNTLTGRGARFDSAGGLSIGYWRSERLSGAGLEAYRNGDAYFGNFSEGARSGNGTYIWKSGDIYAGEFSGNSRNGRGWMLHSGELFQGNWTNGSKVGEGVCRYLSLPEKCNFTVSS